MPALCAFEDLDLQAVDLDQNFRIEDEYQGQFSPDGKWIAYGSDESGTAEIYVQPFPASGGKWMLSYGGGTQPRWRSDGKEFFDLSKDGSIMSVDTQSETGALKARAARSLFPVSIGCCPALGTDEFFVTDEGEPFLAAVDVPHKASTAARIMVVLNCRQELAD